MRRCACAACSHSKSEPSTNQRRHSLPDRPSGRASQQTDELGGLALSCPRRPPASKGAALAGSRAALATATMADLMKLADVALLWGRAVGKCSAPGCDIQLTLDLRSTGRFIVGEHAHIIPRSPKGPTR
jgi:hypothetical protein